MVLALAASMHPAGIGMVLAVAWTWLRDDALPARRRYTMIGGMIILVFFVVFSRMGWPELSMLRNPLPALAGVVALEPGQKKTVTFTLGPEDLQLLDRDKHWVVVPGTFDIMIGKSSADIALEGTLEVIGPGLVTGYE